MKNITVSLDDQTYRNARVVAAERGTSISRLVKNYLAALGAEQSERESLCEREKALRAAITDFRASDRLSRDELHRREA